MAIRDIENKPKVNILETIIPKILFLFALISILTTVGIVFILLFETLSFFREVSFIDFITDPKWTPLFIPKHFGVLPLLSGTLIVTFIASLIAIPIGLGSAIYLSEYAPDRVRAIIKPILEILAGIPTIVYGYFALTFVTPVLRFIFPDMDIFNALSAGIVVGIMIIPMISSLSEDAMLAVPNSIRAAAYGLGSTKFEVATKVIVPAALSGIVSSFVLALSRAIGETMIVTIAAGGTPKLTLNPLESIQTMTAYIVQVSLGDTPQGSIEYKTIFAVGMSLFVLTLIMNLIAQYITKKYREEYQ
ncbi:phosphate ABC transporter permease subunit PstC [Vulcanibacillus modesticaldus]|uniref:Phosphate transport system permease protein n=1 Tax=Vulcanibacillus modesticaldus TaxID=337097 RepID=A0A1D2YSV7_9BACI|nr:phosphate ABC transporter permease subunit PstC [Vulcanibacillus modesticaldus]OEF98091.1 phosphate ABC transporter permease subunit PstC [Vulcanibacillus modesticaldus]